MIGTILGRVVGTHLWDNFKAKLGTGHLQSLVEGYAWRGVLAGTVLLYNSSDQFKDGLDQIIAAVTGG